MFKRTIAALVVASFIALPGGTTPASAENQMGYQLLPAAQAAVLPRNGGALGMNVGPAQQITDGGMTFRLLRVNSVNPNSPGAQAGFRSGDQIIAVDGRVFPAVPAFASYVGSLQPGRAISVDYIPAGGGPAQAQRVTVTTGGAGTGVPAQPQASDPAPAPGLSTGTKIAIGAAAVALFGCYRTGCFSKLKNRFGNGTRQQPVGVQ